MTRGDRMTRSIRVAAAIALLVGALAPRPAAAQALRTVEIARQLRDSLPWQVRVDHAAGKVVIHGADVPLLYQMQLAYDPRLSEASYDYDIAARVLRLGIRKAPTELPRGGASPELRLDLARTIPTDLRLAMGTAEADLELGGMHLTRLSVESGASDAVLRFDTPNLGPMELLEVDVGAASLRAHGLGNARAREMRVNVAVGSVELDFGGDWTADAALELEVALGRATLRVPDDVGVRIDVRRVLASFSHEGFEKRGEAWYSANWDSAPHKLHVSSRTVLGRLTVERGAN